MSLATADLRLPTAASDRPGADHGVGECRDHSREAHRAGFSWRLAGLFAITAAVCYFYNLGGFRTLGTHEAFAAVPAREMMESGDWIIPRFGGKERFEKPPLMYWILATLGSLCGGLNATLVRVPSAAAAVALAVLIGVWAARWYGRDAGWAAAFIQLTSLIVLTYGRKAEIDVVLWLLIAAAMFLIAHEPPDESRTRNSLRWAAVCALLGLSWLAKFHYGTVLVVTPTVLFFLIQKRWRHVVRFLNPLGLLIAAPLLFLWPWLVLQQSPEAWNVWQTETIGRAAGEMPDRPQWYFAYIFLIFNLPWTPLALAQVKQSWRRAWNRADANERFLWVWFVTTFAIVTLQPDKHPHYLAPALPALTLLAGQRLPVVLRAIRNGRGVGVVPAIVTTVAVVAGMAVGALICCRLYPHVTATAVSVAAIGGGGVSLGAWLAAARRYRLAALVDVAAVLTAVSLAYGAITPRIDDRLEPAHFARIVRETVGADEPVYLLNLGRNPLVFYLQSPNRRLASPDDLRCLAARRDRLMVVAPRDFRPDQYGFPDSRVLCRMVENPLLPPPQDSRCVLLELRSPANRRREASTPQREHR